MTPFYSVRLDVQYTEPELQTLAGVAYSYGYQREEPRKRWTIPELKEAARYALEAMARERLSI